MYLLVDSNEQTIFTHKNTKQLEKLRNSTLKEKMVKHNCSNDGKLTLIYTHFSVFELFEV